MPVPVPRKPVAHPVIKHNRPGDKDSLNPSVFQNLTHSLPAPPTRPPPSFGTREEWINSLPSWRRTKPRMIWYDSQVSLYPEDRNEDHFQQGLAAAVDASAIKGNTAQACLPPFLTLVNDDIVPMGSPITTSDLFSGFDGEADDEMSSESSVHGLSPFDGIDRWTVISPIDHGKKDLDIHQPPSNIPDAHHEGYPSSERGSFTPILEEQLTEEPVDIVSGTPITPFGEFVDRAVAAATQDCTTAVDCPNNDNGCLDVVRHPVYCQSGGPQQHEPHKEPVLEPVVTPVATPAYRNLAEPLSEWVANYIWKVCNTGMSLPPAYTPTSSVPFVDPSPRYLAASVHSLLLSTLLQPSAVFLAVWYIVRLPVSYNAIVLDAEHQMKELAFRQELLGNSHIGVDTQTAPFRLIVLGCMLANKWLDDHTFSNKTWHTISNLPINSLNRLESLALDIFEYNISVPAGTWSKWLEHVSSYHMSLSPPGHPQPISRPSSNPHSIVRKAIEELVKSPVCCESCRVESNDPHTFQPVFLGLDERRKERQEKEHADQIDMLEIDLDQDGPIREEYLPRRRVSATSSASRVHSRDSSMHSLCNQKQSDSDACALKLLSAERNLPPPAKWSPAGDEPILRERNKGGVQYMAVQPPITYSIPPPPPPSYPPMSDFRWPLLRTSNASKPLQPYNGHELAPHPSQYTEQCNGMTAPALRSYHFSGSFGQENLPSNAYARPSQTRFEYNKCSDGCTIPYFDGPWLDRYDYRSHYSQSYCPLPSLNYQIAWLRT